MVERESGWEGDRGDGMIVFWLMGGQAHSGTEGKVVFEVPVVANHARSRVVARLRRSRRGREWPGGRPLLRHRGWLREAHPALGISDPPSRAHESKIWGFGPAPGIVFDLGQDL